MADGEPSSRPLPGRPADEPGRRPSRRAGIRRAGAGERQVSPRRPTGGRHERDRRSPRGPGLGRAADQDRGRPGADRLADAGPVLRPRTALAGRPSWRDPGAVGQRFRAGGARSPTATGDEAGADPPAVDGGWLVDGEPAAIGLRRVDPVHADSARGAPAAPSKPRRRAGERSRAPRPPAGQVSTRVPLRRTGAVARDGVGRSARSSSTAGGSRSRSSRSVGRTCASVPAGVARPPAGAVRSRSTRSSPAGSSPSR